MTTARRPIARFPAWQLASPGVGYYRDNLARWLLTHVPAVGKAYAAMLAPARRAGSAPLSANVVAMPRERMAQVLAALHLDR